MNLKFRGPVKLLTTPRENAVESDPYSYLIGQLILTENHSMTYKWQVRVARASAPGLFLLRWHH